MARKCSELYFSGEWAYSNVITREDGSYEVKIVTRDGVECKFTFKFKEGGGVEVIADEDIDL